MRDQLFDRDAAQRETLTARQDCDRDLVDLGRREDEFDVGRRLFERLQQRVEGVLREHVNFVDDVDLVAPGDRPVAHPLGQLADVVDAGARSGVHLHHIDMAVVCDREALRALAARFCRRAARAVGSDAIEGARQNAGRRRLADAAHAGQDEGVGDPPRRDRVRQGAHHRLLPDQLGEGRRPIFAGEDAICRRRIAHSRNRVETRETGRTTQIGARYGCFLPDLTGLARDLSAAGLPRHYISCRRCQGKLAFRGEALLPGQWRMK